MYSCAFWSVGLQTYNLKSPNLSLDEVYVQHVMKVILFLMNLQLQMREKKRRMVT
jgi:hypothetical protein